MENGEQMSTTHNGNKGWEGTAAVNWRHWGFSCEGLSLKVMRDGGVVVHKCPTNSTRCSEDVISKAKSPGVEGQAYKSHHSEAEGRRHSPR